MVYGCRAPVISNSVMRTAGPLCGSDGGVIGSSDDGPMAEEDTFRTCCWPSRPVGPAMTAGNGACGMVIIGVEVEGTDAGAS